MSICPTTDGNLWVLGINSTTFDHGHIFKINTNGVVLAGYQLAVSSYPYSLCPGPDNNVYIADGIGQLWQFSQTGTAINLQPLIAPKTPVFVAVGPDGKIWASTQSGAFVSVIS